jgi:uncharacterized protein YndB with AHSA1/START domain/uncharacterized protein YdhG (YjbR/CyaY superfamily)
MTNSTTDREIVVTRTIDAPRELVFSAFTEQQHAEKWWVPSGTIIHEYDAQPGGLWRYSMPGPDGAQYPFKIKFIEIARPARLVYDYGTDADDAPEPVRTNVTFEEHDGKTKVTLQLLFASAGAREEAAQYGAAAGAQQALGSLTDYLASYRAVEFKEISMSAKKDDKFKGFTDDEKAAMKERAKELKAEARADRDRAAGEKDLLEKIKEMPEPDRGMAARLHQLISENAPTLSPKTWYGMPAYAIDGKVVCFFQSAQKFDSRYATLGFSDAANLDEGAMWPSAYALARLTAKEEKTIIELVKKAVS